MVTKETRRYLFTLLGDKAKKDAANFEEAKKRGLSESGQQKFKAAADEAAAGLAVVRHLLLDLTPAEIMEAILAVRAAGVRLPGVENGMLAGMIQELVDRGWIIRPPLRDPLLPKTIECPQCKATLSDTLIGCPNCGTVIKPLMME